MLSELEPWTFQHKPGFRLRGWRTDFTGKPLIHFLHGNGFCGLAYLPMLKELISDFDLIITDLPGHGDSDIGDKFKPWNGSANIALDTLNYFCDQLPKSTKVFGLGHSYGGVITALMAGKALNRFDKCLLLDPVIFSPTMLKLMQAADIIGLLQSSPLAKKARQRRQHWPNRQNAFDALHGKGGFKNWNDASLWAYVDHALIESKQGISLKCPVTVEAKIYSSYPKNLWHYLQKVESPSKILIATKTYPFISHAAKKLAPLPTYKSEYIEGGHCFMQETPKKVAQLIKDWFLSTNE